MDRYHNPQLQFYCRQSKVDKQGLAAIEMGITINGVRRFINTTMKAKPSDFNRKRKPKDIQNYLDLMRQRFNDIIIETLRNGEPLTTDAMRNYMRTGGYKSYTVGDMITNYLAIKSKEWTNDEITEGQYKKYVYAADVLYRYVSKESEVNVLTPGLMRTIYTDLKGKYMIDTACGYMTRIKAFIRYALDNGKLTVNPMQGIKITKAKHKVEILSDENFNKILAFHCDIPRLMKIRDMFIFACGTGLGYADCCKLEPGDFKMIDGVECIVKNRVKTGVEYISVLLPCAQYIAKKHNYNFKALMMSNQRTNSYLSEIEDLCGIDQHLHFYLGRHYYGHHLLNSGVRAEIVSRAMGHKDYKILLRNYAMVESKTVVAAISKID